MAIEVVHQEQLQMLTTLYNLSVHDYRNLVWVSVWDLRH